MLIFQIHLPCVITNSMQCTVCPEPFINYISEGSVSISTCKFEALPVKTALVKADLSDNRW